jgi:hypothetical protein
MVGSMETHEVFKLAHRPPVTYAGVECELHCCTARIDSFIQSFIHEALCAWQVDVLVS